MSTSPRTGFPYLDEILEPPRSVLAMAHRGGAMHPELDGMENTFAAFEHAVALGYRYLETDVHATADGVLLAFHDDLLDRVTDQVGALAELTAAEVDRALIAGEHRIPRVADIVEAFPQCRFNIDLKSDGAVAPLARLLDETAAHDRVCVGSFSLTRLHRFRALTRGSVATSAAPAEVVLFLASPSGRLSRTLTRGRVAALQLPRSRRGVPVVTPSLVRRAHAAGAHVHVWTIDDPDEMHELIDIGVDGIITDRTDLLKDVLVERGLWRDHA